MRQCQKCGKTLGQNDDYVYGVIEKRHYDRRQTDVSTDPGLTTHKAYAIIRGGVCKECVKKLSKKNLMISIGMLVVSAIIIILEIIFDGKMGNGFLPVFLGIACFVSIFVFIAGVYFTIRNIISYSGTGAYAIKKYYIKSIPKENVLYPHVENDLDVRETTQGRLSFSYLYVGEDELKKPIKGKYDKYPTLHKWVEENDLLS